MSSNSSESVEQVLSLADVVRSCAWETHRELGCVYLEAHYRDCLCHFLQQAGCTTTCEETVVFKTSFGLQLLENGRIDIIVERSLGGNREAMILELKARTKPNGKTLANAKAQTQRYINQFTRLGVICPAMIVWFAPNGQNKVAFLEFEGVRRGTLTDDFVV